MRRAGSSLLRTTSYLGLLGSQYVAELSVGLAVVALHKKGGRSLGTFASSPAGAGLIVAAAVLAVCAAAIVAQYRRRRRDDITFAAALLTNLLTVSAVLVIGETMIRVLTVPTPAGPMFGNTVLGPNDWAAVSAHHRATLQEATARGSYLVFDHDLGWAIGKSRRSEDPYQRYRSPESRRALGLSDDIYLSSIEGLRSPVAGMSLEQVAHTDRVALIGDSFTFGLEVHYEDTWGRQLERMLDSGTQVLNFGVDGYGVDQSLLRYERDVGSWHPKVVILGVINDDLRRTMCVYGFLCFLAFGEIPFPKPRFVLDGDTLALLTRTLPDPPSIFRAASIADLPFIQYDGAYSASQWKRHYYDRSALVRFMFSAFPLWPEPGPLTTTATMAAINGALFVDFCATLAPTARCHSCSSFRRAWISWRTRSHKRAWRGAC